MIFQQPSVAEKFWYICLLGRAIVGLRHPL